MPGAALKRIVADVTGQNIITGTADQLIIAGCAIKMIVAGTAIKNIIADEDKNKPFSDQAIVKKLKSDSGIKIARRTVAKYREMLCILSSAKRKKLF